MKNSFTVLLSVFVLLILNSSFLIQNCHSQWQPDVRLTNDPAISNFYSSTQWCVASSGNSVHVVWEDYRDYNKEIYYKRSTDEGITWGTDTRLTNADSNSWFPSAAVSGSNIHVAWEDRRDGNDEIYYKCSTDGGINWGVDTRLTSNSASSFTPSLAVSGLTVHTVWKDQRDGNWEIYYKRSTDGGISWGADIRLTNKPAFNYYPSVSISGSTVHVIWGDNRDGANPEIYYKLSTDGGLNWGTDKRLTNDPAYSYNGTISASGSTVHLVWQENRDGNYEIYYKRSTDGGTSWGTDTRLTNNPFVSSSPNISVLGSVVHVAWQDNRDGINYEIYYKRSIDGGVSWGADTRLTNNTSYSYSPSISVSASNVHVVWRDERDGNPEIYYKRDPTGNITKTENISSEIPKNYSLSQNYPNPFNPVTKIQYAIVKNGFVKLIISDAIGREVEILVNESQKAGIYEVTFDAAKYPSGVYFYRIITGDYVQAQRMVLIK